MGSLRYVALSILAASVLGATCPSQAAAQLGPPTQLSAPHTLAAEPTDAADGIGNRYVAWVTETGLVSAAVDGSGAPGTLAEVPGSQRARDPQLTGSAAEGAVLTWSAGSSGVGYALIRADGSVARSGLLPDTGDTVTGTAGVIAADGRVTLTWNTLGRRRNAYVGQISPSGDAVAAELSPHARDVVALTPSIMGNGIVHLVWTNRAKGRTRVLMQSVSADGSRGEVLRPFAGRHNPPLPAAAFSDTLVSIAGTSGSEEHARLEVGRMQGGGTYRKLEAIGVQVPTSRGINPQLAFDSRNHGYLAWLDARGIVGATLGADGQADRPVSLSDKNPRIRSPRVAIGPDRRPLVLWRQGERFRSSLEAVSLSRRGQIVSRTRASGNGKPEITGFDLAASAAAPPLLVWSVYRNTASVFGASG